MNKHQEVKAETGDYSDWYSKNKVLIKLLGLSRNDAAFQRNKINHISEDLKGFLRQIKKILCYSLLILLLLTIIHLYFIKDIEKRLYLVAFYFGLIGAFLASYGFLLHAKGLVTKKNNNKLSLPSLPQRPEDFSRYAANLNKMIAEYMNIQNEEKWAQPKVGFRKEIALFVGFILIVISFLIQLLLQFV